MRVLSKRHVTASPHQSTLGEPPAPGNVAASPLGAHEASSSLGDARYKRYPTILEAFSQFPSVIFLLGLLSIVTGLLLRESHWGYLASEFSFNFLVELGIALIIAYFISVSIEKYSRETHNEHVQRQIEIIKRSVFESVYKSRYDRAFVDFVENNIFKYPLFRREYRLSIRILPHQRAAAKPTLDPEDPVVLSINVRSIYENISTNSFVHPISTFIERHMSYSPDEEPRLHSVRIGGKQHLFKDDQAFTNAQLGQLTEFTDVKNYRINVQFLPRQQIEIELNYHIIKCARDELSWRCVDPADGFHLMLSHTDKLVSYATPIHNRNDIKPETQKGGLDLELKINEPLFPHNGVALWWRPKKPVQAGTQTAATA
jgi:hypothetical protein